MSKFLVIFFFGTLFFSFDLPKSAIKKIDKTLADLWPEKIIKQQPINLSEEDQNKLTNKLDKEVLFQISINSKPTAYLFLSKARSKISDFDYMIVFKPDLSILKVKVLVYREEYGGEIGSNRWLKQFIGKSNPDKMKFGDDIQNISGATISARSLTEDVKKVTEQIIELKNKRLI